MAQVRGLKSIYQSQTTLTPLLRVDGSNNTILTFVGSVLNFEKDGVGALLQLINPNKLLFTINAGTSYIIGTNSSDGSDNRSLTLSSTDDFSSARGGQVTVYGNEHSTHPGKIRLEAGNATGSQLELITTGAHPILLSTQNINRWSVDSDGLLLFNNLSASIGANTVDGSDNKRLLLCGGGATTSANPDRGASLHLSGNEESTPGLAQLAAGNATGSKITLITYGASQPIDFWTANTLRWSVKGDGHILPASDNAYDIGSPSARVRNIYADGLIGGSGGTFGSDEIEYTGISNSFNIYADTDDGTDNKRVTLSGGGDYLGSRGGGLAIHGNEHGAAGGITMFAGNAGGHIDMYTANSAGLIRIRNTSNSDNLWYFDNNGNLVQGSTGTGYIQLGISPQQAQIGIKNFGYSSGYKALFIGDNDPTYGNTVSLWFNVDLSANPSGSFGGHGTEYFFRNSAVIGTPNAANTGYHYYFGFSDGDVTYNKTGNFVVRAPTSDGADDRSLTLSAGGAASITRGAQLTIYGNEVGGTPGEAILQSGDTGSGLVTLRSNRNNTGVLIKFIVNDSNSGFDIFRNSSISADFLPITDSQNSLGSSSRRFSSVFAANFRMASGDMNVGPTSANELRLQTSSTTRWLINSTGNFTQNPSGSDIVFTLSTGIIRQDTADGSDNKSISISGGGALSNTRGAFIQAFGNEAAGTPGQLSLSAGNGATNSVKLLAPGTSGTITFSTNGTERWQVNASGNLAPIANNSVSLGSTSLHTQNAFTYAVGTGDATSLNIITNNINRWIVLTSGELSFVNNVGSIAANTNDGTDNKRFLLNGGGHDSSNPGLRGAYTELFGNEAASFGGWATLSAGNVSGAKARVITLGTQPIEFQTQGTLRWQIDSSGHLLPSGTINIGSTSNTVNEIWTTFIRRAGNIVINPTSGAEIVLQTNSTERFRIGSGSTNEFYSNGSALFRTNTTDGSDNASIEINAGGAADGGSGDRGAFIRLFGNEHGSNPGRVDIQSTNGGNMFLLARSTGYISFQTGTTEKWQISNAGHLFVGSHNAYDIGASATRVRKIYAVDLDVSGVTTGTGLNWNTVSGTSASMLAENGYIANNAALVTLTLPSTCAVGKVIKVVGLGAGGWKVAQNSGQIIHFGATDTTTGVGGSVSSTNRRDAIELLCVVADTEFTLLSSVGTLDIV